MLLCRYPTDMTTASKLDPFADLMDWLCYLTAPEYLQALLRKTHNLDSASSKSRAKRIIPHVRDAIHFLEQAVSGPAEVSFLPAYYAILNMAKVYILVSPNHSQLARQSRWHGATYSVADKDSRSLLTDSITLRTGGALSLFYRTLTGQTITQDRQIKMGNVYPYIRSVFTEYSLATSSEENLATVKVEYQEDEGHRCIHATVTPFDDRALTVRSLPALNGFRKMRGQDNTFESSWQRASELETLEDARKLIDCRYIYLHDRDYEDFDEEGDDLFLTPICSTNFPIVEEFPIALAFFHMSSVVRYKPEFLSKIRDSRYWPMVAAAPRTASVHFTVLVISTSARSIYRSRLES
jgi:hypothetical protein